MEKYFHSHKDIKELEKLQFHKQQINKYQNVPPRVNSSLRGSSGVSDNHTADVKSLNRKSSAPLLSKTAELMTNKKTYNKNDEYTEFNRKQINKKDEKQRLNSKSLPKALLELNINDNLTTPCDSPDPRRLVNQGSQTLNTDDINLLYAEGVIRYSIISQCFFF